MNKNIFFYVAVPIIYLLLFTLLVISANAQTRRTLWHGNAAVEGDFDAVGGSISGEAISATGDITAAGDMIIGASKVAIDIDGLETTQDNYVLMLDYLNNKISLEAVTASSLASLDNIEDVTVTTPVDGEFLGYNGAYWENLALALKDISDVSMAATPGMGSVFTWNEDIAEAEFKSHISIPIYSTTIGSATSSLFGDGSNITNLPSGGVAALEDIGDVTITSAMDGQVLEYDAALPGWINATSSGGASTLDDLIDVNISGPVLKEVLAYDGTQWINQVMSGGGGGSAELIFDYIIAATDSINAASANIICDGIADNASIQQAIDLVSSNSGGNILLLKGTYAIESEIFIADASDYINIYGSGMFTTRLNREFTGASLLEVKGDYCSIKNIAFFGNGNIYTGSNDVNLRINGAYMFKGSFLYSYNSGKEGIYLHSDPYHNYYAEIKSSIVNNSNATGLKIQGNYSDKGINISNVIAINNGAGGISTSSNTGFGTTITNCFSYNNTGNGISVYNDAVISNCYIYDNTNQGIFINGYNDVHGNVISENGKFGIYIGGDANYVHNNVIKNNADCGIYAYSSADYNRIEGCFLSDNLCGICLWYVDKTGITNCEFHSNTGDGIYVLASSSAHYATIFNNKFYENNIGVKMSGGYAYIVGNIFFNDVTQPIYLGTSRNYVINNTYFDTDGTQTSLYGGSSSNNYLAGNKVLGAINRFSNTFGNITTAFRHNEMTSYGAAGDVNIMTASASAKVGFATDDPTTITNVITVGSGATTDPIANNWATWSDPELKENIEPVDAAVQELINKDFDGYDLISYDWKYPYPAPAASNFKDIIDDKGAIVSTAKEQYTKELEDYTAKKSAWYAKRNRYKSWALDLNSIPDDVAAYTEDGRKIGYNINQVVMRLIAVIKREKERVNQLEQRITALEAARK